MKIINVLDSKIIKIGFNMYEAHVFVEYKTIFGKRKIKWILLEDSLWAGNSDYFGTVEHAKEAIKYYITEIYPYEKENIVFQGIPE